MTDFSHLIEINESTRLIRIHRVFPDGHMHLFTEMPFPPRVPDSGKGSYAEIARLLGENVLLDSPAARRSLGI